MRGSTGGFTSTHKYPVFVNMELQSESEKQRLIDINLKPVTWTSPSQSDAQDLDFTDGGSSLNGQWESEWVCTELDTLSESEREEKHLARRKLLFACALSLAFMIGEVIGGYAAHSLAIMTDAAHLLTDFGSISISIFSLWISSRPHTETMTFGWHRAGGYGYNTAPTEILAMLLSIASIWAVTAVLVFLAVQRVTDNNYNIDSHIMLITSGCAVGVNILMVLILNQSGTSHGHSHGLSTGHHHSHSHNASVRAAFIHVVGDLLQSVGVLLAAVIIHFWPEYKIADPICTFLFSILVLGTTLPVSKEVFRILMQGAPQDVNFGAVRDLILSVRGVTNVHSLHMWSLNMNHSLLSVHVDIDEGNDSQKILITATQRLRSMFGFSFITIQTELSDVS